MKFKKADLYVLLCHSAGNEKRQEEQTLIKKYNLWQYIPKSEYRDLKNTCKEIDYKFAQMLKAVLKDYYK
tara:strand:- start:10422 stop:10631 length:210 start_codon:yes stop_codon:yes gene_type:complete